jgi:hypothetical protein
MPQKTEISRKDLIQLEKYGIERKSRRVSITELKKKRRVPIGPDATFYFESYDTMFHQIHEMLWIEKGGEEQIDDELNAYNPLIPKGNELVATLMFEINDENRRTQFLADLGGVEKAVFISFDGQNPVKGIPEEDIDRSNANGKASSIQFLHFIFTNEQISKFNDSVVQVTLSITHEKYGHIAIFSAETRAALATDFIK